jgi:hypothetical protein
MFGNDLSKYPMTADKAKELREKIDAGIKAGAALAIEEHRLAGRSIVVWRDGKVVLVPAEEIPPLKLESLPAWVRPR